MSHHQHSHLMRLRPRRDTLYVSQDRTVLATQRNGFIDDGADHGMFVHETRLLSRYRYLIDGMQPQPVALSNVEQHTWLGYYILFPPGLESGEQDQGSGQMREATQQTLELRLSRYVGDGFHEAGELKRRFNEAFWMEDEGFFAMGLDAQKRPIRSIGSNAGHCLATGIADAELVRRAADRLMADDLFSGWGVRTLSARHPAYNPYSYHRGSVWPVEQGTFAIGFLRYGLHEHTERLCRSQFEAAALFEHTRLPELFGGHQRDADHPFPAFYPRANWPQAWSSSALFCCLQALLGLYPYAPLNMLLLDPHLPPWLPEITLHHLRVGAAAATIRFYRKPDGASDYEVLDTQGTLHIVRQPSPWSLTASFGERLKDALQSLVPGM